VEEALEIAHDNGEEEAIIIGGGEIYKLTASLWDKMYITEVDVEIDGDIYFPEIDDAEWKLVSEEIHKKDAKNEFDYSFLVYERNKKFE